MTRPQIFDRVRDRESGCNGLGYESSPGISISWPRHQVLVRESRLENAESETRFNESKWTNGHLIITNRDRPNIGLIPMPDTNTRYWFSVSVSVWILYRFRYLFERFSFQYVIGLKPKFNRYSNMRIYWPSFKVFWVKTFRQSSIKTIQLSL